MELSFQPPPKQQLAQFDHRSSSNGQKLIEERSSKCLEGFVFAFTGTFSRSRQQMRSIVLMHGGGYSPAVNKFVTHFVVGQNPESFDVRVAKHFKRAMINESMFLNIIRVRSDPPKPFTSIRIAKDQVIPQVISTVRAQGVEHARAVYRDALMSAIQRTRVLLPLQQRSATTATPIKLRNASLPQALPGPSKTSRPTMMTSRQSENIPPNALKFKNFCQAPKYRPSHEAQAAKILQSSSSALSDLSAGVEIVRMFPKSPKGYRPGLAKREIQQRDTVRSEPPKPFTSVRIVKDPMIPLVTSTFRVLRFENVGAVYRDEVKALPVSAVQRARVLLPLQQRSATTATQIKPRNTVNALDLTLKSKEAASLPQVIPGSSKTSCQSENIPSNASHITKNIQTPKVHPSHEAQATKILERISSALNVSDSSAGLEFVRMFPKSPKRSRPGLTKTEIQKLARRLSHILHGRREIPEVKPDCLKGHVFVINGFLRVISRIEATDLIKNCGGTVVENVRKSTTHMLLGGNYEQAKFEKAEAMGIQMLSMGEFLNLILDTSEMPEPSAVEAEADVAKGSPPVQKEIKTESPASTSVQVKLPATATIKVVPPESSVPRETPDKVVQITPKRLMPSPKAAKLNFIDEYYNSMVMKPGPYRNARTFKVGDWYTLNNQPTVNISIKKYSPYPLRGKKFVITGILKTIPNREQLKQYLVECGAEYVAAVSEKVTHLIVGDEPADTQVNRAKQNGVTRIVDEDQLMLMLTDKEYDENLPASILDD